jgi:hypothetical protein
MEAFMIDVIIYHHLGMGDHFTCNGLVHTIADDFKKCYLICKEKYYNSVKHLYEDFPKIEPVPIVNEPQDIIAFAEKVNLQILKIGFEHVDPTKFERSFYEQLDIPFENKNKRFTLPKNLKGAKTLYDKVVSEIGSEYIFIHDESSVGKYSLSIKSDLPRFTAQMSDTNDTLDYVDVICNAKEVHIINSGIYPMIPPLLEQGKLKADKIVYHKCRPFHMGGIPVEVPEGIITEEYISL